MRRPSLRYRVPGASAWAILEARTRRDAADMVCPRGGATVELEERLGETWHDAGTWRRVAGVPTCVRKPRTDADT